MISIWGVDHGSEVSKMTDHQKKGLGTAGAVGGVAGMLGAGDLAIAHERAAIANRNISRGLTEVGHHHMGRAMISPQGQTKSFHNHLAVAHLNGAADAAKASVKQMRHAKGFAALGLGMAAGTIAASHQASKAADRINAKRRQR